MTADLSPHDGAERVHSQGGWRDIASAPKDCTEFIAYRPDAGVFGAVWHPPAHEDGGFDWESDHLYMFASSGEDITNDPPTHWMPLPPPPSENSPSAPSACEAVLSVQEAINPLPSKDREAGLREALELAVGHLEEMRKDPKWHPIAHCPVLDAVRAALEAR